MAGEKEKAGFICVKDTIDGAYPSLVLGIKTARQGMESKVFYSFMGLNLVMEGGRFFEICQRVQALSVHLSCQGLRLSRRLWQIHPRSIDCTPYRTSAAAGLVGAYW